MICTRESHGQAAEQPISGSQIKFSLFPFAYSQLLRTDQLWLTVHFESQLKKQGKTFNLTLDWLNHENPGNIKDYDFWVVPQFRHYFSGRSYTGGYIAVFPTYRYRESPSQVGSSLGFGLGTGYQFLIAGRFRGEFNTRLSYQMGTMKNLDYTTGQTVSSTSGFTWLALEVNIGCLFRKQK